MHFWIDKRSQQCGFGRSRVAASLSGSGSGVGLSFGHPPRRIHGSNKSSSTTTSSGGGNSIASVHSRHQQHQSSQTQQQQQQQSANIPSTSTLGHSTADYYNSARNCHQQQQQIINNNNIMQIYAGNQQQQQQHNNANNNPHQIQLHQQQQQYCNASHAIHTTPNTINNNNQHNRLNSSAATLQQLHHHHHHHFQHDVRYHHPQFGNMSVRHYQPVANNTTCSLSGSGSSGGCVSAHAELGASVLPSHHPAPTSSSTIATNALTASDLAGTDLAIGPMTPEQQQLQLQQQQACRYRMQQQHQHQPMPLVIQHIYGNALNDSPQLALPGRGVLQQPQSQPLRGSLNCHISTQRPSSSGPCARANLLNTSGLTNITTNNSSNSGGGNNTTTATNTTTTSNIDNGSQSSNMPPGALAESAAHHHHHHFHHQQQQQQQHAHHRQLHALIDPADTQLLPSHLKSGVCASLILASVFVAAAKFYFDHQNSGLEVLIFIAFSMTFLLAACTVSLCRIPKGMIVQRPTGMHGEHAARNIAGDGIVGGSNSAGLNGGSGLGSSRSDVVAINASNACQQVLFARPLGQEHSLAAQAGPPPYHIAILLPENGCKEEEESPPPSYDKILI